ncbi:uncharacterized protein BJ171DRAFT_597584 [Polychytrium aggregatum]|uniref:uncharacterized protein n=1 Tax=Polychytrium aggregatum TaxID=110093 RepID=UPI0022FE5409|nr:uncharacterized protein BJ171DRAFT_597584 [Polychytrium aggregatum]KAI9206433.1 hypothetical protein BJ171DRAFT_597584 [Polychytrium aggregatum]
MSAGVIAIYAIGSAGDVVPMLALGRAVSQRCGYRVRFISTQRWRTKAIEEGLEYFDHHDEPIMCTSDGYWPNDAALFVKHRGTMEGIKCLLRAFMPALEFLYRTADQHLSGVNLAILTNAASFLQDDCRVRGIPYILCCMQPNQATRDYPPPLLGLPYNPTNEESKKTNLAKWDSVGLQGLRIFIIMIQQRRKHLGLRRTILPPSITAIYDIIRTGFELKDAMGTAPYLCAVSPALLPVPTDVPKHDLCIQSGPFLLDHSQDANAFTPPPDIEDFLATGPIVYFGYGSLQKIGPSSTKEIDHMFIWLDAIGQLEALGVSAKAVLSFSWGEADLTGDMESPRLAQLRRRIEDMERQQRIYRLVGSFPHTYLFPKCHVAVHHGGAGTTQTAVKYRLPAVVVSHFADQPFMASIVKHQGVGVGIDIDEFGTRTLLGALKDILVDRPEFYKQNCDRIASQMEQEDPIGSAVGMVQKLLKPTNTTAATATATAVPAAASVSAAAAPSDQTKDEN